MNQRAEASLRRKLFGILLGVSVAWSLVVAAAVIFTVRSAVDELLDNTLQESAEILYGLIRSQGPQLVVTHGGSLPAPAHDEHLVWQVVSAQGQVVWRSHRAPQQALLARPAMGLSNVADSWRVYGMSLDGDGNVLYVAQVGHVRQASKWRAAATTAAATLIVGVLCAIWLRLRASQALAPIVELSEAVKRYDPMDVQPNRLPTTLTELEPMRHAILDLGERLAQRVASERAFSAHAAHALRTPLAGMMAQLAVAQVKSSPEAMPHLQRMGVGLDRLRSVVAALLTLFRAEQAAVHLSWVRISELVAHLPLDAIHVDVETDGLIWADADLLSAALINLLDNAHKHGAHKVIMSWEHLSPTDAQPASWALNVHDDGQGMPAAARAHCQAALDGQHYEQLGGLGLMLGDLIARAHGGRLRLLDSPQGLRVCITGRDQPADQAFL